MELLLALAVITAVIIFGAMISLGNERQRRAIDELREQVVLWAIQDLRIKREHLAREVRVADPLDWFNQIASKICGYELKLKLTDAYEEPHALVYAIEDNIGQVIFSPISPNEIRHINKEKHSRLSHVVTKGLLPSFPKNVRAYEISALNGGVMFDLELSLAWSGLTAQKIHRMERIWMYMIL